MKQHVFKRSRMVDGKRTRARTYSGRYRLDGDLKDTEVPLGVTDKQVAQSKLAQIVLQKQMERQGLAAPSRQVETASAPLKSLVREWVDALAGKGTKAHYRNTQEKSMAVLMRDCGWRKIADITPESFARWIGANQSKAPKTLNEYHACVRGFLNWLVKLHRLPANPLSAVGKSETRGREVRKRRSYSHAEFLRLVEAGGKERGTVYAVAYYTGLRRSEIDSLTWGDFDLSAGLVRIHAEHAKNKTTVSLPLHPDLRDLLAGRFSELGSPAPSVQALRVPPRLRAFNRDLKTAGIVKKDELGRVADFHCLRHSCATRLASENVPLPVAMRLMRHSDPKLTAKAYVDQGAIPLKESIAKLPGLSNGNQWSPDSSLESVVSGSDESVPVASPVQKSPPQVTVDELIRRLLSCLGGDGRMEPAVGLEPTT